MLVSLLACLWAWAADPQPTVLLPAAVPVPARTGETSWGLAAGHLRLEGRDYLDVGPLVQGLWGASDRLALGGALALSAAEWSAWPLVWARWQLVERDGLRIAPFAGITGRYRLEGASLATITALGVAIEGGWQALRLDASVPLVGYSTGSTYPRGSSGLPGTWLLATSEFGVRFDIRRSDTVRVAALALLPTLGWRHAWKRWFFEGSASTLGTATAVQVRVGVGV